MEKYILLGTIGNPKGVAGDFLLHGVPSSIGKLPKNVKVKVGFSENFAKNYSLEKFILHQNKKIDGKFAGINSKEDAAIFKDQGVFVLLDDILKTNPSFYSIDDILGCEVRVEADNSLLGTVIEVWEMPANDVWLVETPDGELPIPVIDDVVVDCDLKNRVIKIILMDGLMDLLNKNKEADDAD